MNRKLTRRSFLRHSAMTGASFALAISGIDVVRASNKTTIRSTRTRRRATELQLMMVDYSDPVKEALENVIIPGFVDENPELSITVSYSDWSRYNEEMTTAFAAGVTPDVFQGGAVWAPQMAQRRWALPLNDFIAGDAEWDWDDFPPALQADVTVNGQIVGVPYRQDLRTLWYRKDMLAEAGFDAPPTTWDEFLRVAMATTKRNGNTFEVEGYHFSSANDPNWQRDLHPYLMWLEQANGSMLSDDLTQCTVNSEQSIEALQFLQDLVHVHRVTRYPGLDSQGDLNPVQVGQAAMEFGNADFEREMNLYAPEQADNVYPTLPLTGTVQATHSWVNKFFLSSKSNHPEEAWALLRFLTRKDMLELYCAANVNTPPRVSLLDAAYMSEKHKIILECAQYARTFPQHPNLVELFRPIAAELEQCLSGNKSAAEALNDAAANVDEILKEG